MIRAGPLTVWPFRNTDSTPPKLARSASEGWGHRWFPSLARRATERFPTKLSAIDVRHTGQSTGIRVGITCLVLVLSAGCHILGSREPTAAVVADCRRLWQEGLAAMERHDWQRAEKLLSSAVDTCPSDFEARQYYAEVLYHRGATEEAIGQLEAALALRSDAPTSVRSGEMLLAAGRFDEALQRAEQALDHNPMFARAWALRGRVMRERGQYDRALSDLHRSLDFAPRDASVLLDVARVYHDQGRPRRLLATVQHLLSAYSPGSEPPEALYFQGVALLELGRPDEAATSLAEAVRRGRSNVETIFQLGRAQRLAGQPEAAAQSFRRALALDPAHQPSQALLADMQAGQPFVRLADRAPDSSPQQ